MIRVLEDRVEVSGPMRMAEAKALLAEGDAAMASAGKPHSSAFRFDLGAVTEMDSSALAVVFGWVRAAKARGASLHLINPPQNLTNLAAVYGVAELLPLS